MGMHMSRTKNTARKVEKLTFLFGAEPPAIAIETEDGEGFWFEMRDDNMVIALMENTSIHVNRKLRTLLARERMSDAA
jgi:hypothetical protein